VGVGAGVGAHALAAPLLGRGRLQLGDALLQLRNLLQVLHLAAARVVVEGLHFIDVLALVGEARLHALDLFAQLLVLLLRGGQLILRNLHHDAVQWSDASAPHAALLIILLLRDFAGHPGGRRGHGAARRGAG